MSDQPFTYDNVLVYNIKYMKDIWRHPSLPYEILLYINKAKAYKLIAEPSLRMALQTTTER